MPKPTMRRSMPVPAAARPARTLPTAATASKSPARASTRGRSSAAGSASMPICRKNTGTNTCAIGARLVPIEARVRVRASTTPATNAPTIGASCTTSARRAKARVKASARPIKVPSERASRSIQWNSGGASRTPTATPATRKATAAPTTSNSSCGAIEPPATRRTITVRITRPMTSSATAAPSTVRASARDNAFRSPKTRAVMPTLVAVRAAATNSSTWWPCPASPVRRSPAQPNANGNTTPTVATDNAGRPTFSRSVSSVSSPTWSSSNSTPSWPSTASTWSPPTSPSAEGPTSTPSTSSPSTAGWPSRSDTSAPTLAATSTTSTCNSTVPTSTGSAPLQVLVIESGSGGQGIALALHGADLQAEGGDPAAQAEDVDADRAGGGRLVRPDLLHQFLQWHGAAEMGGEGLEQGPDRRGQPRGLPPVGQLPVLVHGELDRGAVPGGAPFQRHHPGTDVLVTGWQADPVLEAVVATGVGRRRFGRDQQQPRDPSRRQPPEVVGMFGPQHQNHIHLVASGRGQWRLSRKSSSRTAGMSRNLNPPSRRSCGSDGDGRSPAPLRSERAARNPASITAAHSANAIR